MIDKILISHTPSSYQPLLLGIKNSYIEGLSNEFYFIFFQSNSRYGVEINKTHAWFHIIFNQIWVMSFNFFLTQTSGIEMNETHTWFHIIFNQTKLIPEEVLKNINNFKIMYILGFDLQRPPFSLPHTRFNLLSISLSL